MLWVLVLETSDDSGGDDQSAAGRSGFIQSELRASARNLPRFFGQMREILEREQMREISEPCRPILPTHEPCAGTSGAWRVRGAIRPARWPRFSSGAAAPFLPLPC